MSTPYSDKHRNGNNGDDRWIRMNLNMSPAAAQILEELAEKGHTSKSEVLRRALGLYDLAVDAKDKGLKVGVADEERTLTTEFVGF